MLQHTNNSQTKPCINLCLFFLHFSCRQTNNGYFVGDNCQFYINTVGAIVGITVGSFVVLTIILILSICVVQRSRLPKVVAATKSGTFSSAGQGSSSYTVTDTRYNFSAAYLSSLLCTQKSFSYWTSLS